MPVTNLSVSLWISLEGHARHFAIILCVGCARLVIMNIWGYVGNSTQGGLYTIWMHIVDQQEARHVLRLLWLVWLVGSQCVGLNVLPGW